jgi:hypothetical protein
MLPKALTSKGYPTSAFELDPYEEYDRKLTIDFKGVEFV